MQRLMPYLLIGAGGFLGANARYLVNFWVESHFGGRFPLGTFVINVSGSFLLGLLGTVIAGRLLGCPDELRMLLGIGFLGAYTTFSTFEFESQALLRDGEFLYASMNVVLSPLIGLLAVRLGVITGTLWGGR